MKKILIAGTGSGCGKTTVTCAVLQAFVNRGLNTAAFKCGPDYIDPMFFSRIIGAKSRNLDGWFCDRNTLKLLMHKNAGEVSVVEGVMGFYDGVGESASSYRLSLDIGAPVVLVIDCKGLSLSIGAVMKGFLTFRTPNNIVGFIFNRLPESLTPMAKNLCKEMGVRYLGRLPYAKDCVVHSRHLGLVIADEIKDIKQKMQRLAALAEENILLDELLEISETADDPEFTAPEIQQITSKKLKIAVARDSAFCFYYEDSLDLLRELGCEVEEFSPLEDEALPEGSSGLILGGGYPELHAEKLAENKSMMEDIKNKICSGLPTIAECGGFMYLNKSLEGADGRKFTVVGVVDGEAYKTNKLQRFGYVSLTAGDDNLLCRRGEVLKAHEFHYWDSTACGEGFEAEKASNGARYACGLCGPTIYAGFPHIYMSPKQAESFVKKCEEYHGKNRTDKAL